MQRSWKNSVAMGRKWMSCLPVSGKRFNSEALLVLWQNAKLLVLLSVCLGALHFMWLRGRLQSAFRSICGNPKLTFSYSLQNQSIEHSSI